MYFVPGDDLANIYMISQAIQSVADTGGGSVVSGPPPSDLMMNKIKINTLIH